MAPKVVVITGCSTGIGLETAVLLASDKDGRFKVFATMRNLAKQDAIKTAAGTTMNKTLFIRQLDVTNEESIVSFMETINREENGVDILINNAGVGQSGLFDKVTMEQTKAVFETNVFGLIRLTQAVTAGMKAKKSGRIINLSSFAGLVGTPIAEIYGASKFAVDGFSESLAPYLMQWNISVSTINPGPVRTPFYDNMSENNTGSFGSPDADVDEYTQQVQQKQIDRWTEMFTKMQTAKEIALVIQKAVLDNKPHLHYITSDGIKAAVSTKYKDPTGDSVINMLVQSNGWDKEKN